ncbi:aa3-type cytochrome oxidase subunit II [Corynebacterium antarcticum]|uniref:cytochrome-c oxidase n=1 Tax=Corynebacterium antarcticum TaxID=2800405 RepID=A0A9Q4CBP7_9CORY|nr:cytochrome c oxidase subunit II [Corynebacterium antarcticum]MCK7641833.1 cytochrome c oxidase subunit II [Corynebacterium antarcticum]MCK7660070.1 cytochrome c oxidase subunit II [Corynebacterium antarcticum]MCX7491436.1 cytochrome c oxidase subunit II [Corynebacterium antarcticum]MCX7537455.1 cytochrome c oxidase subunit II [Corynebacterium antarcticum]
MEQRNKRGFRRKAMLAGTIGAGSLALAGCDVAAPGGTIGHLLRFGWPEGITPEATAMGNFWVWIWVAAWIIGAVMWGLMLYSLFVFSAKRAEKQGKGEFPKQVGYNVPVELVLTVMPILIVLTIFFFTVQTQDKVTALDKDPKVTVDVTAFQWNWKFGYGEVAPELSPTGSLYDGTDRERQAAAEQHEGFDTTRGAEGEAHHATEAGPIHGKPASDLSYLHFNKIETIGSTEEVPVLVLPSQTAIEFDLASADVVHSFWIPEFLFKRDAFPHPEANLSERRFQVAAIEEEGAFVGRCAEMCGTYHAMMNLEIRVVSPERFTEYLRYRMDNPDAPNSEALKAIGEAPYATSTSPFLPGRTDTRSVSPGSNTVDLNKTAL